MRSLSARPVLVFVVALTTLIAMVSALAGCGSDAGGSGAPEETTVSTARGADAITLSVWAAAGLKNAFKELATAFDGEAGSETTLVFDTAGVLQKQIAAGASADVFASSDPKFMNALVKEGFVDESAVKTFASNEVVLIVPAKSALGVSGFEDLAKPEVKKIAVGNPDTTPLGQMTLAEILPRLGVLEEVQPKLVFSQSVSQTLDYVNREEVEAGIVWVSEAKAGGDGVKTVATCDPSQHSKVLFMIAVVKDSEKPEQAQAFVDYVLSSDGQSVLQAHGFLAAPAGE